MLSRTAIALLALLGLLLVVPRAQAAPTSNCTPNPVTGVVTCVANGPGGSGSSGGGAGNGSGGCIFRGKTIPCTDPMGDWWSSAHQCYAAPAVNTVTLVNPHGEQGTWWSCVEDGYGYVISAFPWFLPAGKAPLPDPATLAKRALGQMQLSTARVKTAPAPAHPEVVGVEVWLWVPQSQWGTLSKTVRAGATSVTATAVPNVVTWNMGDGSAAFQCGDAGRPWESYYTDAAQTDCGYTYRTLSAGEPGGVFHITATISYFVTWTCTGACTSTNGNLGLIAAPAGTGSIRSLQRQTVVVTP